MTNSNEPTSLDTSREACPSPHSLGNKIGRVLWGIAWWGVFRISPRPLFKWRVFVLKCFRADVDWNSRIDPNVRIWAPWNLVIGKDASMGHHVDCYNVAKITIGDQATVSQYSFLCSASHDITDPAMTLTSSPITIESNAWVCAKVFVGPGITIHEGAVAGACAVVTKDVNAWSVVAGNPAKVIRQRAIRAN